MTMSCIKSSAISFLYISAEISLLLAGLSGCAIEAESEQLTAEPNSMIVIRQSASGNALQISDNPIKTDITLEPVFDPQRLRGNVSSSIAAEKSERIETAQASSLSEVEQARHTLIRFLDLVENQPAKIEEFWVEAEALAQHYPDDKLVQSIWQRLALYSDWQPVNSVIRSGGIDIISLNGWHPETPGLRARKALLPPVRDNEQVIVGDQRLVLVILNQRPAEVTVQVRLEDIPFLPQAPAVLVYGLDNEPPRKVVLNDNDDWRKIGFTVPAGEHALRFYQEQALGNQFIKLKFDDRNGEIGVAQERPYFISTNETPLEFYSRGPSRLRIDELDEGKISYRYQTVPEGWHTIRLLPPEGRSRVLFRVSQRVANLNPGKPAIRIVQRELASVPDAALSEKSVDNNGKVLLTDAFRLGEQQDGTMSAGLDFVRRNNKQESGATLPEEQFMQTRINYRYFDEPDDLYLNTYGYARYREFGGPVFGIAESVYFNPEWLPFNVIGSAKVNAQAQSKDLQALAQANLTLTQAYVILPKIRLLPSLTMFARTLSMDAQSAQKLQPIEIDQDVYTPYKSQHQAGFSPALTLQAKPWLDTVVSTRVGLGTNEDFSLGHPDHYNTEAHWQQMLGSVALDASYRIAFYQPDNDRVHAQTRSYAGLEANWQHWLQNQNRLEVSAQYSYDIERKTNLAMLSFTWHLGEGRGLRDFDPTEIDFRDIRQRQFVGGLNNTMRTGGQCLPSCLEP